jgi:hypothetical protein
VHFDDAQGGKWRRNRHCFEALFGLGAFAAGRRRKSNSQMLLAGIGETPSQPYLTGALHAAIAPERLEIINSLTGESFATIDAGGAVDVNLAVSPASPGGRFITRPVG